MDYKNPFLIVSTSANSRDMAYIQKRFRASVTNKHGGGYLSHVKLVYSVETDLASLSGDLVDLINHALAKMWLLYTLQITFIEKT